VVDADADVVDDGVVVVLGDPEFPEGDRDLQFPAVFMVTTDLRAGMLLAAGVDEDGDDGNGVDFLAARGGASESGVVCPRCFFLTSFWTTRTRSTREREELGVGAGEEVAAVEADEAWPRRLTLATLPEVPELPEEGETVEEETGVGEEGVGRTWMAAGS